jgi:hypothetical protein
MGRGIRSQDSTHRRGIPAFNAKRKSNQLVQPRIYVTEVEIL